MAPSGWDVPLAETGRDWGELAQGGVEARQDFRLPSGSGLGTGERRFSTIRKRWGPRGRPTGRVSETRERQAMNASSEEPPRGGDLWGKRYEGGENGVGT